MAIMPEPAIEWVTVGERTRARVNAQAWSDATTVTVQIGPVALTGEVEHLRRLVNELRRQIPDAVRRLERGEAA